MNKHGNIQTKECIYTSIGALECMNNADFGEKKTKWQHYARCV